MSSEVSFSLQNDKKIHISDFHSKKRETLITKVTKVFFIYRKNFNNYGTPATKEQRDLLFQKMKEAGYEWDAEKKELK